jgi:uncharacterized protein YjbJ (UPF0337 family)
MQLADDIDRRLDRSSDYLQFSQSVAGCRYERCLKGGSMNRDQIEGNWKNIKGKVKERWGKLTDDDLTAIDGKKEQLVGKLQERYGDTKEDIKRQVDDFCVDCERMENDRLNENRPI